MFLFVFGVRESIGVILKPVFILVRPQMGENIGSAARAMLNFGIDSLRIVNPRDGWPNPKAKALASGAGSVLDGAVVFDSVKEACQDMHYIFASSARERKLDKKEISLAESISECKNLLGKGSKVGFLFGPEQSGLSNEDIAFADKIVFLNTSNVCTSINLSQCVMLFAYEWFQGTKGESSLSRTKNTYSSASKKEMDQLLKRLILNLDKKGYFWPLDKEKSLKLYLQNLFSKLPLNTSDIRFFHGLIRSLSEERKK